MAGTGVEGEAGGLIERWLREIEQGDQWIGCSPAAGSTDLARLFRTRNQAAFRCSIGGHPGRQGPPPGAKTGPETPPDKASRSRRHGGDIANLDAIRFGHLKLPIQVVRRHRQGVVSVGAIDAGLSGCATVLSDQKVMENTRAVTGADIGGDAISFGIVQHQ